jgi:hypothetical protein
MLLYSITLISVAHFGGLPKRPLKSQYMFIIVTMVQKYTVLEFYVVSKVSSRLRTDDTNFFPKS